MVRSTREAIPLRGRACAVRISWRRSRWVVENPYRLPKERSGHGRPGPSERQWGDTSGSQLEQSERTLVIAFLTLSSVISLCLHRFSISSELEVPELSQAIFTDRSLRDGRRAVVRRWTSLGDSLKSFGFADDALSLTRNPSLFWTFSHDRIEQVGNWVEVSRYCTSMQGS